MPVDIFPEINIPVVSVVWTYNGMSAPDIQNRILSLHERQMASLVDDIARIEATSYDGRRRREGLPARGRGRQPGRLAAGQQRAGGAQVHAAEHHAAAGDLRYGATDVPIIQLSLSSKTLPDTKLNDLGQNIIRPDLAVVHGAEVPLALRRQAARDHGRSGLRRPCRRAGCRPPMSATRCSARTSSCRPATSRSAARITSCR